MKFLKATIAAAVISMTFAAQAVQADETLARSSGCMACHGVDNKIVGPGLKEIAAKYKGDDTAAATLAAKVKSGGSGNWGQIPMPPNAHVADADISTIVGWILSL